MTKTQQVLELKNGVWRKEKVGGEFSFYESSVGITNVVSQYMVLFNMIVSSFDFNCALLISYTKYVQVL